MGRYEFRSGMADEIRRYLDYKESAGYKKSSYYHELVRIDRFCIEREINDISFSRKDAEAWTVRRKNESEASRYARVNFMKNFLIYLNHKGYDVYVLPDIRSVPSNFVPHIYSDDEITAYFLAVDTYDPRGGNRKNLIQLPVLFRILFSCGTRINETLGIRKKDVDLSNGIIALYETKNNCARYIVLSDEMRELLFSYAEKCFYLLSDDDYIFTNSNGGRLTGDVIYDYHRLFLEKAGIPYLGDGHGPRLHDWRHTFAVRSFKQMIDMGYDMYVALPILSAYLGHKTIYATEKYIRLTMGIYPYIEEKCSGSVEEIFGKAVDVYEGN